MLWNRLCNLHLWRKQGRPAPNRHAALRHRSPPWCLPLPPGLCRFPANEFSFPSSCDAASLFGLRQADAASLVIHTRWL